MSEPSDNDPVTFLNTAVELVEGDWCVVTLVDGAPHVVSRHADRTLAEDALRELNASANDRRFQP